MGGLSVIEAENIKVCRNSCIQHGFFTRQGGVSQGIYHGLNIGIGSADEASRVIQNRVLVAAHFGLKETQLLSLRQCHSTDVVSVAAPFAEARPEADALVSNVPGLLLGVATADCAPVLFADDRAGVIGAAHAGWRGAYGGILENTITAMERLGARRLDIVAALGPCIGPENYQVGEEFFLHFIRQTVDNHIYFVTTPEKNHYLFDLWHYIADRLTQAGISCLRLDLCTYIDETRFYSYRRMRHRGENDYGRQMSAILLG